MNETSDGARNLIFIHGSGGNGAVWAYQSKYFSRHHKLFAVDLPGHGRNRDRSGATVAHYADYITSFIREKSLATPILIGHSLGGAIALRIGLDKPSEIGGLVLVGTGARLRVLPAFFKSIKTDFDKALTAIGEYSFSPQAPEELVAKAMSEMKKGGPDVLYDDFTACDRFDVMSELQRITAPTLVVVGRDDRLTPVKYAEYLHKNISGARLEIVERAGHMVMIEQPDVFNAVVDGFLHGLR